MRVNPLLAIFIVAILGFSRPSLGLVLDQDSVPINPIRSISYFEDLKGSLSFEDIQKQQIQSSFKPIQSMEEEINFGYSKSVFWLKLPLSRAQGLTGNWVLELPYFGLSEIDFYESNESVISTGSSKSITARPVFYRFYAFPISLGTEERIYYIRVSSNQPISVPIKLWGRAAFLKHMQLDTLFQALYYGGIGVLAIFNLFLFIYLRDKAYLFYAGFAFFIGFGIFSGNGYGRLYLWPNLPHWDDISQAVLLGFATAIAMLFANEFLKVRTFSIFFFRILSALAFGLFVISLALWLSIALVFTSNIFFMLLPLLVIPSALLTIYIGLRAWLAGHKSAKFFLLAWGVLAIGGLVASLRMFDVLPSNSFTSYALQISSAIEMILLAFALASRIQDERDLRESAQQEVFNYQERLVDTLKASEERLENQVAMRTNDLKMMLKNEKKLREQYIRFGSMISHEFRNPLGIIETQTALLVRDGIDQPSMKRVSIISSATHRLAVLFDRWLQGDRLQNGIDHVQPQIINLTKWMKDLLERCRNYHANHVMQFIGNGDEKILVADEKMLEVVALNLIDNACKYSPPNSVVTISIICENVMIGISVADQGVGISHEDMKVIFDEYKQLNQENTLGGIGLGLAFVKKVIEFHGGRIDVKSEEGAGSEFIAWFPHRTVE